MQNKTEKAIGDMDPLKEYLKEKKKEALQFISSAAKLVAPYIEGDVILGFTYVCEALKAANLPEVESEMEAPLIHEKEPTAIRRVTTNTNSLSATRNERRQASRHNSNAPKSSLYHAACQQGKESASLLSSQPG